MAERACNDCEAPIFDQRYLKCGACLRRIGVVPLLSPVPPVVQWKEVARSYRARLRMADQHEINLKRRLGAEHEKRATLINMMADMLMDIAYDADDPNQEYCNVCHRSLIEEDGHQAGCLYVEALGVLTEAGRSV
jgi:molybdenum cofactor biosynthesis enzyme MoaA